MNCLYILEINPLSVVSFANIFSHFVGCLFVLCMISFALQKLFFWFLALLNLCCWMGSSLAVVTGASLWLGCTGFSLRWSLLLWCAGSVAVLHGLSCTAACGVFLDQGSNAALAGGFFTTEPSGRPLFLDFLSGSVVLYCCFYASAICTLLIAVAFSTVREPDSSTFLFSLRIILAIIGLLCFHTDFKNFCSSSVKDAIGNLMGIALSVNIGLV